MKDQENKSFSIVKELGDLADHTIISEQALAEIFDRHEISVKRAIEREELPPPVRLFGKPVWTVQCLRDHMAKRLEIAQKETDKLKEKINKLGA